MPRTAVEAPTNPETMTENQRARRLRVLEAVLAMIGEGGVRDLQMRELADRSGVALGTVYRYFSSKDHVVAAALVEWGRKLDQKLTNRPVAGATMQQRLKAVLRQGVRPFQHEPEFARVMIDAGTSEDPFASECYQQLGGIVQGVMARAVPELSEDERDRVLLVVGGVWYTSLVEWVSGRASITEVYERLDTACEMTLGWRER
ncbi:MAG: TetR family transcriptional regulator [Acidimicrobiales bacterium]